MVPGCTREGLGWTSGKISPCRGLSGTGTAHPGHGGATIPGGLYETQMWHLGTRFSAGLGSIRSVARPDDLKGLCTPNRCCDSSPSPPLRPCPPPPPCQCPLKGDIVHCGRAQAPCRAGSERPCPCQPPASPLLLALHAWAAAWGPPGTRTWRWDAQVRCLWVLWQWELLPWGGTLGDTLVLTPLAICLF